MGGRHPDVDDCEVRLEAGNHGKELGCGSHLCDDLEALLAQQARQALAEDHRVVCDD